MTSLMAFCSSHAAPIIFVRLGPRPGTSTRRSGFVLDDVEGVRAEVFDDAVGDARADALDQAGAQIAADALDRRGQEGGVVLDGELLAVLRVGAPAALHAQRFARLRPEQRADDGQQIARAAARVDPRDGVAALLVGVGDPLQDPFHHGCVDHGPTVPPGSDTAPGGGGTGSPSRGPSVGRAPRFPLRAGPGSPRAPPLSGPASAMTFVDGQRLRASAELFLRYPLCAFPSSADASPVSRRVSRRASRQPTCVRKRSTISASTSVPSRAHSAGWKISTSSGPR